MNSGRTVFAQMLGFVPFAHFEHLVDKYQANRWTRDFTAWSRKLPHQVDNSKLEIPVLNVLGMNSMGVLSPRESWGLNSL